MGCLLYVPQPGIEPAASVCALTGTQKCSLVVYGTRHQPTEPPGQINSVLSFKSGSLTHKKENKNGDIDFSGSGLQSGLKGRDLAYSVSFILSLA